MVFNSVFWVDVLYQVNLIRNQCVYEYPYWFEKDFVDIVLIYGMVIESEEFFASPNMNLFGLQMSLYDPFMELY